MLRVLLLNLCLIFGGGRPRVISYYPLSESVRPLYLYITSSYNYIEWYIIFTWIDNVKNVEAMEPQSGRIKTNYWMSNINSSTGYCFQFNWIEIISTRAPTIGTIRRSGKLWFLEVGPGARPSGRNLGNRDETVVPSRRPGLDETSGLSIRRPHQ